MVEEGDEVGLILRDWFQIRGQGDQDIPPIKRVRLPAGRSRVTCSRPSEPSWNL